MPDGSVWLIGPSRSFAPTTASPTPVRTTTVPRHNRPAQNGLDGSPPSSNEPAPTVAPTIDPAARFAARPGRPSARRRPVCRQHATTGDPQLGPDVRRNLVPDHRDELVLREVTGALHRHPHPGEVLGRITLDPDPAAVDDLGSRRRTASPGSPCRPCGPCPGAPAPCDELRQDHPLQFARATRRRWCPRRSSWPDARPSGPASPSRPGSCSTRSASSSRDPCRAPGRSRRTDEEVALQHARPAAGSPATAAAGAACPPGRRGAAAAGARAVGIQRPRGPIVQPSAGLVRRPTAGAAPDRHLASTIRCVPVPRPPLGGRAGARRPDGRRPPVRRPPVRPAVPGRVIARPPGAARTGTANVRPAGSRRGRRRLAGRSAGRTRTAAPRRPGRRPRPPPAAARSRRR